MAKKLSTPTDLDGLLDAIGTYEATRDESGDADASILWKGAPVHLGDLDYSSLPTFGGEGPSDTTGVWSWDATRLLIGEGADDFTIVERC